MKRIFSFLLALCLIIGLLPAVAVPYAHAEAEPQKEMVRVMGYTDLEAWTDGRCTYAINTPVDCYYNKTNEDGSTEKVTFQGTQWKVIATATKVEPEEWNLKFSWEEGGTPTLTLKGAILDYLDDESGKYSAHFSADAYKYAIANKAEGSVLDLKIVIAEDSYIATPLHVVGECTGYADIIVESVGDAKLTSRSLAGIRSTKNLILNNANLDMEVPKYAATYRPLYAPNGGITFNGGNYRLYSTTVGGSSNGQGAVGALIYAGAGDITFNGGTYDLHTGYYSTAGTVGAITNASSAASGYTIIFNDGDMTLNHRNVAGFISKNKILINGGSISATGSYYTLYKTTGYVKMTGGSLELWRSGGASYYDASYIDLSEYPCWTGTWGSERYATNQFTELNKTQKYINIKPHALTEVPAVAPNCTSDGTVQHWNCSKCGKNYAEAEGKTELESIVAPSNGEHVPGEIVKENEVPADCVNGGTYDAVTYCLGCGVEVSRTAMETEALGHTEVEVEKVDATPEREGHEAGTKCSVCGEILSGCEVIPKHLVEMIRVDGYDDIKASTDGRCSYLVNETTELTDSDGNTFTGTMWKIVGNWTWNEPAEWNVKYSFPAGGVPTLTLKGAVKDLYNEESGKFSNLAAAYHNVIMGKTFENNDVYDLKIVIEETSDIYTNGVLLGDGGGEYFHNVTIESVGDAKLIANTAKGLGVKNGNLTVNANIELEVPKYNGTDSYPLYAAGDITIDGGNYKLSSSATGTSLWAGSCGSVLRAGGNITINDGNLDLYATYYSTTGGVGVIQANGGEITINGGNIAIENGAVCAFRATKTGTVTINGGNVTTNSGYYAMGAESGTLKINGGTVEMYRPTASVYHTDYPVDLSGNPYWKAYVGTSAEDAKEVKELPNTTRYVKVVSLEGEEPACEHAETTTTEQILTNATCTVAGSKKVTVACTACGEIISETTEEIKALGHTEAEAVVENFKDSDLNNKGSYDSVVYCSVCNAELKRETIEIPVKEGATAEVNGKKYYTLLEAWQNATANSTIKLLADVDLTGLQGMYVPATTLTLDLNEKTLYIPFQALAFAGEGFTIKNGTIDSKGASYGLWIGGNAADAAAANVTIEDVTVNGGINIKNTTGVTLKNVTVNAIDYYAVWAEYNAYGVVIESGTYNGAAAAVNAVDADAVTVKGGKFNTNVSAYCEEGFHAADTDGDGYFTIGAHEEETIPAKAATCTETGLTAGKKCAVCGEILVAQEEIKALGHTEETIPGKDATCEETGLTEGKKCSVCGEILVVQETIEAKEHVWDAGVITTKPGKNTEGVKTFTCENDPSHTKTEILPVLPEAIVNKLGAITYTGDYYIYDLIGGSGLSDGTGGFNMQVAMQFLAKDTAEEAASSYYADYTTDFYIEINGLSDLSEGNADGCYLAGYYATFGGWVLIPLDGFTLENGVVYPVITSAGFDFSYEMICGDVKDFTCGICFTDDFLAKNPNVEVNLSMGLSEDMDKALDADFITVEEYVYDEEDLNVAPAASVNGIKFYTLEEAIAYAQNGDTVKLLADVVRENILTIPAGKTITLDLNGKTVSMETAENAKYCLIYNAGNLTVTDSGENGKLSYCYTGTKQDDAFNTIESAPGSVLTVQGGIIENLSANCLIAYAIDGLTNAGGGDVTVNIEGGKISSKKIAVRIFANSTTNIGTLNISGGEIFGRVIIQNASAKANKAALNITGGTFQTNGYKTDVLYVGGSNGASGDITASVTGGNFNGEILSSIEAGFISGGIFNAPVAKEFCAEGYQPAENADGTFGVVEHREHYFDNDQDTTCNGCDYVRVVEITFEVENNKLVVADPNADHIYHRVTVYYLGDKTVDDITKINPLLAIDPSAKTYWTLGEINKVQLLNAGNYVVHLNYNTAGSPKYTVAKAFTVEADTAPTLEVENGKLVASDNNANHLYHRVTVYYLGSETVKSIYDEAALKAIDANAKTYWGLSEINKVQLTKSGNYVLHLNYNTPGSDKFTVAVEATVVLSRPTISRDGYKLKVTDNDASHKNHRATVYFVGDNKTVDIYDEAALKAIDANAKTSWGLNAINKVQMATPGTYVIYLSYNLENGSKQTMVVKATTRMPVPSVWLEENGQIGTYVPTEVAHRNYEIYYLGDQTVENIYDINALKAIDADPIKFDNQKQIAERGMLTEKGNYVLVMYYNYVGSARQVIAEFATLK